MRRGQFTTTILCSAFLALVGAARASSLPSDVKTFRFLVSLSHSKEDCLKAVDEASKVGEEFLTNCDWGCVGGDHTCYRIMVGEDEAEVQKMLPAAWKGARIVKLVKFTAEQVRSFHRE